MLAYIWKLLCVLWSWVDSFLELMQQSYPARHLKTSKRQKGNKKEKGEEKEQ
jgi:hypothetical protein